MTIGLPRAMLYYRYHVLWETFFGELGLKTITSEETNRKIMQDGINFSIDECCLPAKIFMGHVYSLIGRCDSILVPRVASCEKKNDVCVKLNALYDIARNTFPDADFLDYNVDAYNGNSERQAFIDLGKKLGFSYFKTVIAYQKAKKAQEAADERKCFLQGKLLEHKDKTKILIVSHSYNSHDRLIGYPIVKYISSLGGVCVFPDAVRRKESRMASVGLSASLSWIYNKELLGAIKLLENKVDGIVILTAFPCGPDSLVNELIVRKTANVPVINIILDELQGEAGMQTRLESFFDVINEKKQRTTKTGS
jgi:predicted nucleotide-binding protein (sugar kinase/HSP70/actin superfamily)